MGYIFTAIASVLFTLIIVFWPQIHRNHKNNTDKKKFNRLLNGNPSHVMHITRASQVSCKYQNPLYINGKKYSVCRFIETYTNKIPLSQKGLFVGYLEEDVASSSIIDGKIIYKRVLYLNLHTAESVRVQASLILDVH